MRAVAPGATVPSLALIGCGQWGRNLARNFHALGALKAVHDRDGARAAELAEAQGVPAVSLEALLRDPTLKALVIATLPESHAALARLALEAGKHVFVEKPLAGSAEEAAELVRLARRAGEPVSREALSPQAEDSGESRLIDVQMTRLRRKIEDDPRFPRFLQTVRGRGYVLQPD